MLHLCRNMSFSFTLAKKYVIKNLQFLIEAPPTRPANAYSRFVSQQLKGKVGISVSKAAPDLAIQWKHIEPEKKAPLENQYKAEKQVYQKIKAEYDLKYVQPFKRSNTQGLLVKHLYDSKLIQVENKSDITAYAKQVAIKLKTITPEEIAKFKEIAKKTTQERHKLIEKYRFPKKIHHSQTGHSRAHPTLQLADRAKAFEDYEKRWKGQVDFWLKANNIELTIDQFVKKYNAQLKKIKIARALRAQYGDEIPKQRKKPSRTVTGALRSKKKPSIASIVAKKIQSQN